VTIAANPLAQAEIMIGNSILITGGTGSFGKAIARTILKTYPKIKRLVIFSRDELKQYEMAQEFLHPAMRFFIGDVRDHARLIRAMEGVETVIHAAALKQVPTAEYNPFEFIKTNVLGAQNLIESCLDTPSVRRVVSLSTDKAAAPINLYGATKLCSDKLFIAANTIKGDRDIRFSVVRYGNVMGSRGSVIPFFLKQRGTGVLPITDAHMTRFNITLQQGVDLVLWAAENAQGGELFVPKIPSYHILALAEAICPDCKLFLTGIRPGEKIHEEMITSSDSLSTVDMGDKFAILPTWFLCDKILMPVEPGFTYNSETNPEKLAVDQLRKLIKENVDDSV